MKRLKIPKYRQHRDSYACGPTCVRMVVAYLLNRPLTKEEREAILQSTMKGDLSRPSGTRREAMIETIRGIGFACRKIPGAAKETKLRHLKSALGEGRPAILWCNANFQGGKRFAHYVVAVGIDETHLYINDPYPGKPSRVALASFVRNGRKMSWGTDAWGVIVGPRNRKAGTGR